MAWMLVKAASPVHFTGDRQEWCSLVNQNVIQFNLAKDLSTTRLSRLTLTSHCLRSL